MIFTSRLILMSVLLFSPLSHAGSNPCITFETFLDFASGSCHSPGDSFSDSVIFEYPSSDSLDALVLNDLAARPTGIMEIWNDITFRGSIGQPAITLRSADINTFTADFEYKKISTGKLTLENINLDSNVEFLFNQPTSELNFINAKLSMSTTPFVFLSTSPLTINALSGINTWSSLGKSTSAPTTININSGSTFTFVDAGLLNGNPMTFDGASTVNVNSSTLNVNDSQMDFKYGTFNLSNGGTLNLLGSNTSLDMQELNADTSSIGIGRNTTLSVENELSLTNANINLASGSVLNTGSIYFQGTNSISSNDAARVNTVVLAPTTASLTTLNLNGVNSFDVDLLSLDNNVTINVNYTNLRVKSLYFRGGDINVTSGGSLTLANGFIGPGALTADGGIIFMEPTSVLQLTDELTLTLTNQGIFDVAGGLYTGAGVSGSPTNLAANGGEIIISGDDTKNFQGIISPGFLTASSGRDVIGTLITDAKIKFSGGVDVQGSYSPEGAKNLLDSGLFDGGYYLADLRVSNGVAENDKIQFGDGDVLLGAMKAIKVNVHGSPTAAELDRKQFTVIERQTGKTGVITTIDQSIDIEEGGSVPALIDFIVFNSPTEVVLLAESSVSNILKHSSVAPSLTGSANITAAANLLVNSANAGNTATANSLNTLTNSQVASHVGSIHAEPYSSYMTISLEHADLVMNTVLNHTTQEKQFSTGRNNEVTDQKTNKRTWMDVSYSEGDVKGEGNLGDFDYSLSSLTIGQDLVVTDDRTLGVYFSFGTQKMGEHDKVVQDFDSDAYHLGVYLHQSRLGAWDLRGALGYAYGDNNSKRRVALGNTIATPSADFNSHTAYAGLMGTMVGYQNDWVALMPELGFNYTYYTQESFKESGDPDLSLTVDSADAHAIVASIGVNAHFTSLLDSVSLYPLAFVRYEHDFYAKDNNEHEIDAALVSHPDYKQAFVGQNRGENSIITGIGLGSDINSALQVNGGFVHAEHSHGSEWGAAFNATYQW